jgi:hypothetical protein
MVRILLIALGMVLAAAAWAAEPVAPKPPSATFEKPEPRGRQDWDEKVTVVGRRNLRQQFAGRTFRGTEGFADGSAPELQDNRNEFSWQVYYAPDGTLEARFRRYGAVRPHGPLFDKVFTERGTWRIDDGWLCQAIPAVGSGAEVCLDVQFRGRRAAMYYATCGALTRCYEGRLGPEGEFFSGRQFVDD